MTRKEIIEEFTILYYGDKYNLQRELEQGDKIAARCALLDYVDALNKEGRITERQAQNFTAPAKFY